MVDILCLQLETFIIDTSLMMRKSKTWNNFAFERRDLEAVKWTLIQIILFYFASYIFYMGLYYLIFELVNKLAHLFKLIVNA